MKAVLTRRHHEAENIISFWFEPEKPMNYLAGQFIEMHLPHSNPDDRGIKRWFTFSSSPSDAPLVSITTKFNDKSSSFKAALKNLKPGDMVDMSEPMGDFVLPKDPSIPLVFVAGGIGITPFHSIVKWLKDTKQERDIHFVYSVRNEHEMVFQDLFEHYGLQRSIVVGEPTGGWDGLVGQLNGQRILELTKPADNALIYISGPEPMVESFTKDLEKLGIPKAQLVGDFFPGYTSV